MTVGEVVSTLISQALREDETLLKKDIYCIDVSDDSIDLYFSDSSTEDYTIKLNKGDAKHEKN